MASAGKIRCTKCGADNREGAKFCSECATPFAAKCPRCGAANKPGAKFCDECAASLASPLTTHPFAPAVRVAAEQAEASALDGERKTVTALFADIKGSTELEQDLDPEEARAIIDPALKIMIDAARHYDGYVQSTGDGIFALFGAPVAHEDHPQRALHAALRMQQEIRRYGDRLLQGGGVPIEIRVGVNTGEVVVRSLKTGDSHSEYAPIGHTTNLASRMQALARSGSVAVSEATRKLVEGYFALKPLGPTKVKGISEPVNVYEVTGLGPLRTRLQRSAGRGLSKFVGRQHEMETMKAAAEQAKAGRGQIFAAIADAGVGKSRLLFEFKATSQSGWLVLDALSLSHEKATAYLPLIDLLHIYFRITPDDDARTRREKVAGKVTMLDRSLEQETLPHLFALLGIVEGEDPLAEMDAQVRRRRTQDAVKRILLRESLNQPLMLIFEDLHWIDEETQAFLNLFVEGMANAPILLLVNYRPEYSHQWNSKSYYTQLRLDPLGRESAEEMLSTLLGDGPELAPLKRIIIEKTGGNPLFMEEIFQALIEDGSLKRNGSVKLVRPVEQLRLPPTVQGILAARIDRLRPEEKELLQTLAVIGTEFPLSLVRKVVRVQPDHLDSLLRSLQTGEFIYEQPAAGEIEYTFKHALTRQVADESLLSERRKLLHERVAQALESVFAEQLDDHLDELARHYSRSDNVVKAVEYLGRAGQQAMRHSAHGEAFASLNTAIRLLRNLPEGTERIQRELFLQLALGPALFAVRGWGSEEAVRAYTRARELCDLLGNPSELFPALFGLWAMHMLRGEIQTAHEIAGQLMRRAQSGGDPALLHYAHHALGQSSSWMGDLPAGNKHLEMAFSLYDPGRHRALTFRYAGFDGGVHSLSVSAWILWFLGYPQQALAKVRKALVLAKGLSHPHSLVFAEYMVAALHRNRRGVRAAQQAAERVIALASEHGLPDYAAFMKVQLGWAMAEQGHHEEGIAQIREGLADSRARGDELMGPEFLCLLAEACGRANRLRDGLSALTEALGEVDKQGNHLHEPEVHRIRGELLLMQGDCMSVEAENCFNHAIEVARRQSAKSLELRATTSLARLLCDTNRREEARTMLADIYGWFTEGFDTADLKDAKALLDELSA